MSLHIDILLATFNGGKHLREQLDSILGQDYEQWRLIIRDDGSSDDSLAIINEYLTLYPERITLLDNEGRNLGVVGNFSLLLEYSTADYIMFSDQDDIWLPHKISATFEKIIAMENRFGSDVPLLVYTNQTVVDEKGSDVLADSVWEYQQLDTRNATKINRLLLQNIPTGCTIMINRALRDMASPIPADATMHDWWLALVAAAFGKSDYVAESTMLYRQHGRNVCGAEEWSLLKHCIRFLSPQLRREIVVRRERLLSSFRRQASVFVQRYGNRLSGKDRKMIHIFATLDGFGKFQQKYYILKYRFFYSNGPVTFAMILFRW